MKEDISFMLFEVVGGCVIFFIICDITSIQILHFLVCADVALIGGEIEDIFNLLERMSFSFLSFLPFF